ncbi:hypothetical protein RJT34_10715 [Clitoria ternatea]|uniref:NB-ARC domain-containing protein n=1 Tax=Clitoria ternatea TaxID=43366 RepID=A0AAN9JL09_CLITE
MKLSSEAINVNEKVGKVKRETCRRAALKLIKTGQRNTSSQGKYDEEDGMPRLYCLIRVCESISASSRHQLHCTAEIICFSQVTNLRTPTILINSTDTTKAHEPMDCATGFLSSISTELAKKVVKQLRYPCCFNNFVEDLKKEEGNLIATSYSVQDRVRHAKEQMRKPAEVVEKWLNDANIEADNVKQLLEEASTERHYCVGHCPNWIWRYRLGKKLAKKKLVVEDHIKDARNFIQFDRIATLPSGLPDLSKDKCFNFESRQIAYEKLMEAMKDDEVSMIGLYGMGGCGKTTLAMQVGKVAEAEHLFDKVLFVPVSSTVDIRRIQEKIASSLQYTFPENEERERAERLRQILTEEEKILVILDDVWQMLNFGDIGVPSREDHEVAQSMVQTDGDDPTEINLEEFNNDPPVHSSMVFQNLQQTEIECCDEVDQIIVNHNPGLFSLPSLRILTVWECSKLSGSLLEASIVKTMTSLEELNIQDCNGLKYIVDGHDGINWDCIFQRLKRIVIRGCDKLEAILPICCLPELESLHIEACEELKQIFEKENENVSQRPCFPKLETLIIINCLKLKHLISVSPSTFENSVTFQRLQKIKILYCDKLEAIFPISCLPELESLTIDACRELKQIFEKEDENVFQRPCFPKLQRLCIINCNKLISVSPSECNLPNLTSLIICGASELQQVFKVPKLEVVILVQVPRLCQGNELQMQNVKHRYVHNSPNLTSTIHTIEELKHKLYLEEDIKDFHYISDYTWAKIEAEAKKASKSGELPSPQKLVDDQSMTMNEPCPTNQQMAAAETETTISIPQNIEIEAEEGTTSDNIMIDASLTHSEKARSLDVSRPKAYVAERDPKPKSIPQLQMNQQELPISERGPLCSEVIDNNQSIQGNITGREHEQKRIEREELVSESYNDFLESNTEGKRTPQLQFSKQKLSPISSPKLVDQESSTGAGSSDQRHTLGETTTNIKETGKEKIQEKATPKGGTIKTLAAGVEGISLGGGVATHTESGGKDILAKDDELNVDQKIQKNIDDMIQEASNSNLVDKERRTSVVCNDGVEIPPEAIEVYPHLWNVCNNAVSITPQREKDFDGLCDEAVELGFDRSWVDQMRQRVVVAKYPKLDNAQTRISELHMSHAHLTQQSHKINNELKNLQEFVDSQTKCFNFL